MISLGILLSFFFSLFSYDLLAESNSLVDQLIYFQERIQFVRQSSVFAEKKNHFIFNLEKKEQELVKKRMDELEKYSLELHFQKEILEKKHIHATHILRKYLIFLQQSEAQFFQNLIYFFAFPHLEQIETPKQHLLTRLIHRMVKEVEMIQMDRSHFQQLESKIQEEKQLLTQFFQFFQHWESLSRIQTHGERIPFEYYHQLKRLEMQIDPLLKDFYTQRELETTLDTLAFSNLKTTPSFYSQKGTLPFPAIEGKILSLFGRVFNPKTGLTLFQRGLLFLTPQSVSVKAVASGQVAFAGKLPHSGFTVILNHGDPYFTLYTQLQSISVKPLSPVSKNQSIGWTQSGQTPLYFEIRSKKLALDPTLWLAQ